MIIEWFTDSHSQSLMSKPPDLTPARMNIIVIVAENVSTCHHRRHVAMSHHESLSPSHHRKLGVRRRRSVTQSLATLAQTTHLNSSRALKSSEYCRSFVSSQVITPGAFSFTLILHIHYITHNVQYNIPGVTEERRAWIHLDRSVSPVTLSLSVCVWILGHTFKVWMSF